MRTSIPITANRARLARALIEAGVHDHDIATLLCCNQPRIYEIHKGLRFPEAGTADITTPVAKAALGALLAQAVLRLTGEIGPLIKGEEK